MASKPEFELKHVRNCTRRMCERVSNGNAITQGEILTQILACQLAMLEYMIGDTEPQSDIGPQGNQYWPSGKPQGAKGPGEK